MASLARALCRTVAIGAVVIGLTYSQLLAPVMAADPPWGDKPYGYRVIDQDLQTLLREFGRNTGVATRISPKITGSVQSMPVDLPPREYLDRIATNHGLAWYYDGGTLHVTPADEVQAKVIDLPVEMELLRSMLADIGALDDRYPLRSSAKQGVAIVNGPQAYVSLVEQAIEVLRRRTRAEVLVLRGGSSPVSR